MYVPFLEIVPSPVGLIIQFTPEIPTLAALAANLSTCPAWSTTFVGVIAMDGVKITVAVANLELSA